MAGPIRIAILANGSQARRELKQVANEGQSLGSMFANVGRKIATGLAVGGAAVGAFGVSAIKSASDSQQSLGATESVFKRYANTVIDRSNKAAQSVGLSANEYRELSNVTGAMLKNSGKPLREVTDLTAKLTGRAADLAATYGGTTKEAIEAVNSLLRGEADPIERYGVSIKQSDINARLAAKGLDKLEGSAKKQADAQARLELLFKQTGDAAGQFGRENDTVAGQQQRLTAEFANTKSELGTALIPLATDFFKVLRSEGVPAVQKFAGWLSENSDEITDTGRALGNTLLPVVKDTVGVVGDLIGFVSKLPPGLVKVAAVAGLGAIGLSKLKGGLDAVGTGFANTRVVQNYRQSVEQVTAAQAAQKTAVSNLATAQATHSTAVVRAQAAQAAAINKVRDAHYALVSATQQRALKADGQAAYAAATRDIAKANDALTLAQRNVTTTTDALARAQRERLTNALRTAGGAARSLAGPAGLAAVVAGASSSNDKLKALGNIGGGALAGLGVAGPAGLAVGGLVGLLATLAQGARDAGRAAQATEGNWKDYANTLDEVTGAVSAATSKMAFQKLQEEGVLKTLNSLGVSNRVAVNATLGRADASKQLAAVLANEGAEIGKLQAEYDRLKEAANTEGAVADPKREARLEGLRNEIDARKKAVDAVREQTGAVADATQKQLQENASTRDYTGLLRGLPKAAVTDIRTNGIIATSRAVTDLANKYRLTPRQVVTLVKASGVQLSGREIRNLARQYNLTPKQVRTVITTSGAPAAKKNADDIVAATRRVNSSKGNLSTFNRGVQQGLNQGKQASNRGAADISRLLFQGTGKAKANTGPLQNSLRTGISSARNTASSGGSGIGSALSNGVSGGIFSRVAAVASAAASMVRSALAAARSEAQVRSPSRKTRKIGHQMGDGLAVGLKQRRAKAKREAEALVRAVTARLDAARTKYRDLFENRAQYASAIRETVRNTANITELGKSEDGTVAISALLDQLKTKVNQAKRFSYLVQQLAKKGLSKANIDQLLNAGPEAATATAEAITVGGASAIKQLNSLTYQLDSTGTKLGNTMANSYYKSGVDAAAGLVRGLESQLKKVEAAAKKIADAAKKGTKKRLKSNSPSKVFEQIGRDTVRGFTIGLDETTARRQATRMADGVVKGFGTPALDAYMSTVGQGSPAQPIVVYVTSDEIDQLQRGRTLQADLDAYRMAGGRARA